ncbi:MAG: alpha-amylase/4-alpha-glucanotransferase domain-containing protein [Gemmatimonadota bacterium]|nr:alpha-amylase/4-alpha-glucanotransferase domain-containing protein [Gemmatimonadota bacterium]
MSRPSVVVHGHFYQPPREDPVTGRVPRELSAAPYHDWNERILAECYRPVTEARVLDRDGRIRDVLNTLEWMSWDAGPTLLRWLAREAPATYAAFLEADARSVGRAGTGNALAAPYHHMILPLASRRDKVTEVRWGIADFRRRFGREPEGMWLPETAVDTETLEVLADEGIAFTVLAPDQVETPPADGMPGKVSLGGGRSIAVFIYDGALSHGVAFGSLLGDADAWIRDLANQAKAPDTRLVSLATDGETFGHHHPWSDMALAATLSGLERRGDVRLESYASFLRRNPPVEEVTLVEPSSWSCAHGVERWRAACGCKVAPHEDTQQAWRKVLRDALDELAGDIHALFEEEASVWLDDPWALRDAYGRVLEGTLADKRAFVRDRARPGLDAEGIERLVALLEAEVDALRMFTSCGWFFDDLARLEPLQVLRYAAHALDLLGLAGGAWEERLRARLAEAESNDPAVGDGRRIWDEGVRRGRPITGTSAEVAPEFVSGGEPARTPSGSDARKGTRVRDAPLLTAVRRFLRAPGPEAAREASARAHALRPEDHETLRAAQTLFAHHTSRVPAGPDESSRRVAHALGFGESSFQPRALGGRRPVGFVFGLHLHQPVGNFDSVFRSHTDEVYLPFLERLADRELLPLSLHVSGPLLEWLERARHPLLDRIGDLASEGQVEMLLSGLYEPVLPALSRTERFEQIEWMSEWVERRFGVEASGLWLTERVWEPDLAEDLVGAGVRHAFVDDRHFLVAGHPPETLHRPHTTEAGGHGMALLPIDERLRYLVPFRPVSELEDYVRGLRGEDYPLAILADDGEKFGGWPGTAEWVWESGWLEDFLDTMTRLVDEGVVEMLGAGEAVETVPHAGPSYLPSAAYREMEGWSLPAASAVALEGIEETLERIGVADVGARFVRGGHWRNFMSMYPESGRMHRKASLLADLARQRDAPPAVRHAVGRARCNDAYWHGVFGGLYLKHLREAIWASLAEAEEALRVGEPLELEGLAVGGNGTRELWVHSHAFSSMVDLDRGGAVTELTSFAARLNLGDVLTRRWESYHRAGADTDKDAGSGSVGVSGSEGRDSGGGGSSDRHDKAAPDEGMPSIHDMEERLGFTELPPYDAEDRALTVERVLDGALDRETYEIADYEPLRVWSSERPEHAHETADGVVRIALSFEGRGALMKELTFEEDGALEIAYRWDPAAFPEDAWFAPELSLSRDVALVTDPEPADWWRYEIRTMSKSERGAESSVQGLSVTPLWPCSAGRARVRIEPGGVVS